VHVAIGARPVKGCLDQLGEVGGDLDRRHAFGWYCHGDGGWGCVLCCNGEQEKSSLDVMGITSMRSYSLVCALCPCPCQGSQTTGVLSK
jgi:hypothetical protein